MTSSAPEPFDVWEGVYPTFRDAPAKGLGFDDPIWRERSANAARAAHADFVAGRPLDYSLRQRNSVLAVLAASVLARQSRIRVLDFGGGPGFGFLVLQAAIPEAASRIDYHVVEVDGVCREAATMFEGRPAPTFRTTLPEAQDGIGGAGAFDIVFTASTLQYIDDWKGICRRLADLRAPYLAFSDVFAGSCTAYATTQQYYGSKIPHWILNEDELVAEIQSAGYRLQLRTACNVKVLGSDGDLPMSNFPPEKRLKNTSHLLFALASLDDR